MRLLLFFTATVLAIIPATVLYGQLTDAVRLRAISPLNDADETLIRFVPEATAGYDGMWDAWKFFAEDPELPTLYSHSSEGWEMGINSIPFPTKDTLIPVTMDAETLSGEYLLELEFEGTLNPGYRVGIQVIQTGQKLVADSDLDLVFDVTADSASSPRFLFAISPLPVFSPSGSTAQIINHGATNWTCALFNGAGVPLEMVSPASDTAAFYDLADGDYYAISLDDFGFSDTTWFTMNSGNVDGNPEEPETGEFASLSQQTVARPQLIFDQGRYYLSANLRSEEQVQIAVYTFAGQQVSNSELGLTSFVHYETEQSGPFVLVLFAGEERYTFKVVP